MREDNDKKQAYLEVTMYLVVGILIFAVMFIFFIL
jgi:hypothetical protein